jgi:hypothetical protein
MRPALGQIDSFDEEDIGPVRLPSGEWRGVWFFASLSDCGFAGSGPCEGEREARGASAGVQARRSGAAAGRGTAAGKRRGGRRGALVQRGAQQHGRAGPRVRRMRESRGALRDVRTGHVRLRDAGRVSGVRGAGRVSPLLVGPRPRHALRPLRPLHALAVRVRTLPASPPPLLPCLPRRLPLVPRHPLSRLRSAALVRVRLTIKHTLRACGGESVPFFYM